MELFQLLGKLSFSTQAVLPGRLHQKCLQLPQIYVSKELSYQIIITLNNSHLEELKWWRNKLIPNKGAYYQVTATGVGGKWSKREQSTHPNHINILELRPC